MSDLRSRGPSRPEPSVGSLGICRKACETSLLNRPESHFLGDHTTFPSSSSLTADVLAYSSASDAPTLSFLALRGLTYDSSSIFDGAVLTNPKP